MRSGRVTKMDMWMVWSILVATVRRLHKRWWVSEMAETIRGIGAGFRCRFRRRQRVFELRGARPAHSIRWLIWHSADASRLAPLRAHRKLLSSHALPDVVLSARRSTCLQYIRLALFSVFVRRLRCFALTGAPLTTSLYWWLISQKRCDSLSLTLLLNPCSTICYYNGLFNKVKHLASLDDCSNSNFSYTCMKLIAYLRFLPFYKWWPFIDLSHDLYLNRLLNRRRRFV